VGIWRCMRASYRLSLLPNVGGSACLPSFVRITLRRLPTFILGLREGLEATLVVGIIATSLRRARALHRSEARRAVRAMWVGVAAAVTLSAAAAVGLQVLDRQLPQRDQERLETVVAAAAVAMVTLMILWMRRNARGLAISLQAIAATALRRGSAAALVAMAFLAVIREGIETAVFMRAAFQASGDAVSAGLGATLGVLLAAALGYGIYRGGVRIDLSSPRPGRTEASGSSATATRTPTASTRARASSTRALLRRLPARPRPRVHRAAAEAGHARRAQRVHRTQGQRRVRRAPGARQGGSIGDALLA
jgi:thiamine transporter ThiT